MPGLSGPRTTSVPESVTAERTLRSRSSGSSSTNTVPCSLPPVVAILRSGACRSMIRAPTGGMRWSGTTNTSPKRVLKRAAMSRMSSTCWRWSSPTGTSSARYSSTSAAMSTG